MDKVNRKLRRRRATRRHPWLKIFSSQASRKSSAAPGAAADDGQTIPNRAYGAASTADTAPIGAPLTSRALVRAVGGLALLALLCGVLVLARHFARTRPEFAIRAVRVSPTLHVNSERLLQASGVAVGQNLFSLDLEGVRRNVASEPWLRSVRVRRELPATISIEVEEYTPAALVALESLYLVDPAGVVFKRATPEEALGRPVITGLGRDFFLEAREESTTLIREALAAIQTYKEGAGRPALGEIHSDAINGLTLYTAGGTSIRLGRGEPEELAQRLHRLDAVYAALARTPQAPPPVAVFVDNRAHPEHVTVRLQKP